MTPTSAGSDFTSASFRFLEDLEENNDRAWFTANRSVYEQRLRDPFTQVLEEASERLAGSAMPLVGGSATMFRINRDLRFSADKSPYSTHVSGVLTTTGRKDAASALVYLHLDAPGGFMAAGLYQPSVSRLEPLRRAIVEKDEAFDAVLAALDEVGLVLDRSDATRAMPRGFADGSADRHAPSVRLRNFMVTAPLQRRDWTSGAIPDRIATFALGARPLMSFIEAHP